jgi:tRNA (Thr-GGU) A37 N-methylase
VRSARVDAEDDYWGGLQSKLVLVDGLEDESLLGLEEFSHCEVIFFFDKVDPKKIVTGARHPRNNPAWPKIGIFAQRGKNRPNRIGSTIVRVIRREARELYVAELDAIDGTPVLDIKPVMQEFLPRQPVRQPSWSRQIMEDYWKPQ